MKPLSELENFQSGNTPMPFAEESLFVVSAGFKKSQHLLDFTIETLFLRRNVAHWLFVTLTFAEHIRSTEAGQKKLNSLLNAVRKRYGGFLWVLEPHKSGSVHYHLLIPVDFDCHDGTDLNAWAERSFPMEGQYFHSEDPARCGVCTRDTFLRNSMNPALQIEADWWQVNAKTGSVAKLGWGSGRVPR